jgi:hypothetical protein
MVRINLKRKERKRIEETRQVVGSRSHKLFLSDEQILGHTGLDKLVTTFLRMFKTFLIASSLSLLSSAALFLGGALASFSVFLILHTIGRAPWTGHQPVAWPLPTHRTTQTQNKRTQSSVPPVEFEPTISVLEREKTVYACDHATSVIGGWMG